MAEEGVQDFQYVAADTQEDVGFLLHEHHIPYDVASRHVRYGGERHENLPAYRFLADGTTIELAVFTRTGGARRP